MLGNHTAKHIMNVICFIVLYVIQTLLCKVEKKGLSYNFFLKVSFIFQINNDFQRKKTKNKNQENTSNVFPFCKEILTLFRMN